MPNPPLLSVSALQKLPLSDLERLVQSASGHATRRWLTLGRCLLVLGQNGRLAQCGCSGTTQYAGLLGIKRKDAADCKRVASCLEGLPLLRAAAEAGRVGWGALCEVTQKATSETDARWLEAAQRYSLSIIERMVEATAWGDPPCDPDLAPSLVPEESWLHLKVPSHVAVMFQKVVRQLSLQARTPMSAALCQELVLAEFLAGTGTSREALEKEREEARKDAAAKRRGRGSGRQMLLEGEGSAGKDSGQIGASICTEPVCAEKRPDGDQPDLGHPLPVLVDPENESAGLEQPTRLVDDDPPETALAALAGRGAICPSDPSLRLLVPDTDTGWENPRLRFSEAARLATPAQRREMMRRDGYCCSVPGCPNKLWLDLHHVVFYCEGGVTLPANLIVICSVCHRNIHKGRLKVTGTAPDGLRWTTRRGHELDRPFLLEPHLEGPEGGDEQTENSAEEPGRRDEAAYGLHRGDYRLGGIRLKFNRSTWSAS